MVSDTEESYNIASFDFISNGTNYLYFIIIPICALGIIVLGTNVSVVSIILALASAATNVISFIINKGKYNDVVTLPLGKVESAIESLGGNLDDYIDISFDAAPGIGFIISVAASAVIIILCIIALITKKPKATPIRTEVPPAIPYTPVATKVCPICENILKDSDTVCCNCGTPVGGIPADVSAATVNVCAVCRNPLAEGVMFCENCGTPVSAPTPQAEFTPAVVSGPVCAACGNPLAEGVIFCENCGTPVSAPTPQAEFTPAVVNGPICAACGNPLAEGVIFCENCGTPVSAPAPQPEHITLPSDVTDTPPSRTARPEVNVCRNCGYTLEKELRFCVKCGTPVSGTAAVPTHKRDVPASSKTSGGLISTMRPVKHETPEEAAKKASAQSFFNKPTNL